MDPRPSLQVAVLIERQRRPSQWEDWRFRLSEVVLDEGQFGDAPRLLRDDGRTALFLYPQQGVTLRPDEAEGYYLNLSSGAPVWFVMWRHDTAETTAEAPTAWPELVTVSYNEAGRLLDAQEQVDNVPLPDDVRGWLQAYADAHYRPEPKKRSRPASFLPPEQR